MSKRDSYIVVKMNKIVHSHEEVDYAEDHMSPHMKDHRDIVIDGVEYEAVVKKVHPAEIELRNEFSEAVTKMEDLIQEANKIALPGYDMKVSFETSIKKSPIRFLDEESEEIKYEISEEEAKLLGDEVWVVAYNGVNNPAITAKAAIKEGRFLWEQLRSCYNPREIYSMEDFSSSMSEDLQCLLDELCLSSIAGAE